MKRLCQVPLRPCSSTLPSLPLETSSLTRNQIRCFASKRQKKHGTKVTLKPKMFRNQMDFPVAAVRTRPTTIQDLDDVDDSMFRSGVTPASFQSFDSPPSSTSQEKSKESVPSQNFEQQQDDGEGCLTDRDLVPGRGAKPHEIRKALSGNMQQVEYIKGDLPSQKQIREQSGTSFGIAHQVANEIPVMSEKDVADMQGRPEAKAWEKKFKFMPNPFKQQGITAMSDAEYYQYYFTDRQRKMDRHPKGKMAEILRESAAELGVDKKKRVRIPANKYWIDENYKSPEPSAVATMKGIKLRKVMMNEAKLVRTGQKELDTELWDAFGTRAVEIASRCRHRFLLRVLQCYANVQHDNFNVTNDIMGKVCEDFNRYKSYHFVFILNAANRLRFRDPRLFALLKKTSLVWPMVKVPQVMRASNAVSRLDLSSNVWAKGLGKVLEQRIPLMHPKVLKRIKPLTVIELLSDEELHVRLVRTDLWDSLHASTKEFLEEARRRKPFKDGYNANDPDSESESESESDDELDSDLEAEDGEDKEKVSSEKKKSKLPKGFSSDLHVDVSRVLTLNGIEHRNGVIAGPFLIDIFASEMIALETNAPHQFYTRSHHFTATARRRHELLRAMGFTLIHIPHMRWDALSSDDAKLNFLKKQVPQLFKSRDHQKALIHENA